ncbi:UNVERIFIED_CONTAM: Nin1 binding protein [Siphonaria sp. JEL0065]|nr:Nin1 binding protein [Siphonaria sp. JEL0065]
MSDDGFQEVVKGRKGRSKKHGHSSNSNAASSGLANPLSKVEVLVADTAAFIRSGVRLDQLANKVVTIDEVLFEVRDYNARRNLDLAFALSRIETRRPSDEAVAAVAAFAKKTGDFGVLSLTDLKVLALTWMLEKEAVGSTDHLRAEPKRATPFVARKNVAKPSIPVKEEDIDLMDVAIDSTPFIEQLQQQQEQQQQEQEERLDLDADIVYEDDDEENADVNLESATIPPTTSASASATDVATTTATASTTTETETESKKKDNNSLVADGFSFNDGDDDDGWITPGNIAKIKASHEEKLRTLLKEQGEVHVGCITSDFAMQNVLLQMNLKLISIDGIVIKKAKSWIMRCHGCYKTTTDMTKVFCPACGNHTLMRTSCSVDGNGKMTYYLKRNYQYNLRGTQYAIPTPKGGHAGKTGGDMILREDQKEFQAALRSQRIAAKKVDYLDQDYIHFAESSGGGRSTGSGGRNNASFGGPVVGHGKKNPNSGKGRRRK